LEGEGWSGEDGEAMERRELTRPAVLTVVVVGAAPVEVPITSATAAPAAVAMM
jgi:hypothetical protein